MKSIHTRFLAIVAVIVMALGCAVVAFAEAEDPYADFISRPANSCIIQTETALTVEPSAESEQIATLGSGTVCHVLGQYYNEGMNYCIVDLAVLHIDGHETGYGFINESDVIMSPKWVMLKEPVLTRSTPWMSETNTNTNNGMVSGLVMVFDKNEDYYAIHTMDNLNGTSFIHKQLEQDYSKSKQELYVVPMSTPVYDDSRAEQVGEIPAFSIIDVVERDFDFYYVTANPGTSDEFSGWMPSQPLQAILN